MKPLVVAVLAGAAARAEAIPTQPALMRERTAAKYLDLSPSWLQHSRVDDVKALREGRQPAGPPWVTIGKKIFYRRTDLDEWIARNSVERGVVAFSNRGAGK